MLGQGKAGLGQGKVRLGQGEAKLSHHPHYTDASAALYVNCNNSVNWCPLQLQHRNTVSFILESYKSDQLQMRK